MSEPAPTPTLADLCAAIDRDHARHEPCTDGNIAYCGPPDGAYGCGYHWPCPTAAAAQRALDLIGGTATTYADRTPVHRTGP